MVSMILLYSADYGKSFRPIRTGPLQLASIRWSYRNYRRNLLSWWAWSYPTGDRQEPVAPSDEETLDALNDLVQQGKVRYVGCCNFSAW